MFNSNVESQTSDSQCPSPRFTLQLSHVTFQRRISNLKLFQAGASANKRRFSFFLTRLATTSVHACRALATAPKEAPRLSKVLVQYRAKYRRAAPPVVQVVRLSCVIPMGFLVEARCARVLADRCSTIGNSCEWRSIDMRRMRKNKKAIR